MKVTVDQGRCCSGGNCAALVPEVFDQRDDDGVVILLAPEPGPELHEAVREASTVCPSAAITVRE
jgi:ferredoxin